MGYNGNYHHHHQHSSSATLYPYPRYPEKGLYAEPLHLPLPRLHVNTLPPIDIRRSSFSSGHYPPRPILPLRSPSFQSKPHLQPPIHLHSPRSASTATPSPPIPFLALDQYLISSPEQKPRITSLDEYSVTSGRSASESTSRTVSGTSTGSFHLKRKLSSSGSSLNSPRIVTPGLSPGEPPFKRTSSFPLSRVDELDWKSHYPTKPHSKIMQAVRPSRQGHSNGNSVDAALDPTLSALRASEGPSDITPDMLPPEIRFPEDTLNSATGSPGDLVLPDDDEGMVSSFAASLTAADPSKPKSNQPFSRSPELRVSHKIAERKRRKEMKELFDELREHLPPERGIKSSKWEILSKSIDYVVYLKKENTNLTQEVDRLRRELDISRGGTGAYQPYSGSFNLASTSYPAPGTYAAAPQNSAAPSATTSVPAEAAIQAIQPETKADVPSTA